MAQGDFTLFEEYMGTISNIMDLDTDVLKLGLVTTAVTPLAGDTTPAFTDYTEVTPIGGNYSAGGTDISGTYIEAAGTATLDGTDVTWLSDPSNPTNARWAILYDDTAVGKDAIGFFDIGSIFDMTTGDLQVNFHGSGIHTTVTV